MDKTETMLKEYLEKERSRTGLGRRPGAYPEAHDLAAFIEDKLKGAELERMLDHLRDHRQDAELVLAARRLMAGSSESEGTQVPAEFVARAKSLMPGRTAACPHCGKPITPFKKPPARQRWLNALWLAGMTVSFALSFVFPARFYQCLAAALLFGIKWIVDQKATRTQILIYKALEDGEKSHLHRGDSRL